MPNFKVFKQFKPTLDGFDAYAKLWCVGVVSARDAHHAIALGKDKLNVQYPLVEETTRAEGSRQTTPRLA